MKSSIRLVLSLFVILGLWQNGVAQTFSGGGGPIPDTNVPFVFELNVKGLPAEINTTFGLESVCVNINHTWDKDLSIYLQAPDGAVVDLARRNGKGDDNYTNTCFSMNAETSINDGSPPFSGNYLPETAMGGINNGQNPNGTWKLVIVDTYPFEESGKLLNWKLKFSKNPAKPFPFTESELPIVVIKSLDNVILDEPKVKARFGIIDNGPGKPNKVTDAWNNFDGYVGIEIRGKSSQRFSKLSYGFETRDSTGEKVKNVKLLDFSKDNDFILSANYVDKSLLRNYMAYTLWGEMGNWTPHMRFVNLVMDGEYRGVYMLMEKIKRGKHRVNIDKLKKTHNAGDSITGGYIIKTDWKQGSNNEGWTSKYKPPGNDKYQFFIFHYPTGKKMTTAQKNYIQTYVDDFERSLANEETDPSKTYDNYIDVASWVDMLLMGELGKNVDALWLSTYYHKPRGEKLKAGPVWDYDIAFGNFNSDYGYAPNGWHWYEYGTRSDKTPMYWFKLAEDPAFQNAMKCRWTALRRTVFDVDHITQLIDEMAAKLYKSQKMNFQVWPTLGHYIWPNAKPYERDYEGEVRRLKEWFIMRIAWMDAFMPGTCS